ncbi:MAG: hypothetical protein ABFS34_03420 [Gemmatimonadota bacterium]
MSVQRVILLTAGAALMAACDSPAEPSELLVAAETQAALALSEALPTLDRMAVRRVPLAERETGAEGEEVPTEVAPRAHARATVWSGTVEEQETRLARASALWLDADSMPEDLARSARERAYGLAAPVLAVDMDPAFLEEAFADLQAWIDMASPAVDLGAVPDLKRTLQEGSEGLELARGAAAAGDTVMAVRATLRSADALRETTPPVVAVRLIRETAARLAAQTADRIELNPDPRDRRAVALARARRLLAGAREAMGEGDPVLAIRHAYYADRLLDGIGQ